MGQTRTIITVLSILLWVSLSSEGAKVGPIELAPTLRLEVEGNDNVNSSGTQPKEDVILKARLNFRGRWEIREGTDLNFEFGFGHERYLENEELSSDGFLLSLSPQTSFDFTIRFSDFISVQVKDSLRFYQDPSDLIAVDPEGNPIEDVTQYNRFDNTLSFVGLWEINSRTTFVTDLSRRDNYPLDDQFEATRRTVYRLSSRFNREVGPGKVAGVMVNYSITEYAIDFQNDGTGYGTSLFFNWQITPLVFLEISSGYQWNEFDNNGRNQDSSDPATWVGRIALRHSPHEDFSYSLAYEKTEDPGFVSNTISIDKATLSWSWAWSDTFNLTGINSYEWGSNSGTIRAEDYERWIVSVRSRYEVGEGKNLFGELKRSEKTSNLDGRSYEQTVVIVGIDINF